MEYEIKFNDIDGRDIFEEFSVGFFDATSDEGEIIYPDEISQPQDYNHKKDDGNFSLKHEPKECSTQLAVCKMARQFVGHKRRTMQ